MSASGGLQWTRLPQATAAEGIVDSVQNVADSESVAQDHLHLLHLHMLPALVVLFQHCNTKYLQFKPITDVYR